MRTNRQVKAVGGGTACIMGALSAGVTLANVKIGIGAMTGDSETYGAYFAHFDPPAVNRSGMMAFEAQVVSGESEYNGIWFVNTGFAHPVTKIAKEGDGAGTLGGASLGNYASEFCSPIINDDGDVGFMAKHSDNTGCPNQTRQGIHVWNGSSTAPKYSTAHSEGPGVSGSALYYMDEEGLDQPGLPESTIPPMTFIAMGPRNNASPSEPYLAFYASLGCGGDKTCPGSKHIWVDGRGTEEMLQSLSGYNCSGLDGNTLGDSTCVAGGGDRANPFGWASVNDVGEAAVFTWAIDCGNSSLLGTKLISEGGGHAGAKTVIASTGDLAFSLGSGLVTVPEFFTDLRTPMGINNAGRTAFRADVANEDDFGMPALFRHFPSGAACVGEDGVRAIAHRGTVLPSAAGTFYDFGDPAINHDGHITVSATFRYYSSNTIDRPSVWRFRLNSETCHYSAELIAYEGEASDENGSYFLSFQPPFINDQGDVAFLAVEHTEGGDVRSIWLERDDDSVPRLIIREGDSMGDISGTVESLRFGFDDYAAGFADPDYMPRRQGLNSGNEDGRRTALTDRTGESDEVMLGFWAQMSTGAEGVFGATYIVDEDLNGDGIVDGGDLLRIVRSWGARGLCAADVNGDGVVNGQDYVAVASHWGPCLRATKAQPIRTPKPSVAPAASVLP